MMRLPDRYFEDMYAAAPDPWQLADRWYEARKYAITMAMLPDRRYRHAFEPGCSVGVLTARLVERCDHVTACDVAQAALDATRQRLGARDDLTLAVASLDADWPRAAFDLVVLSEVAYYLSEESLRGVLDRECARLERGATVIAAHWRHRVADYPLSGDEANAVIAATAELSALARYRDDDVVIEVFCKGPAESVAVRAGLPGATT
ncbi:SAM-dependent methyltransferase [Mycolicibacterium sp. 050158]|uniref:SAM-dependent methyltransferase n=1 Tax=Mycolicibacterium sp. 050158 TaxID=3090602 RepID=UPI00299DD1BB|nr:SAM-dependent methyltransferase [Mycolicibacterium sp. 050158]MDX1890361.1 SAM-dependent methyltransferase [Mycolicibacterium sp. 050158]